MENHILTASLIGNSVKNSKGERVAKIEELVIDPGSGRIVGAVLAPTSAGRAGHRRSTVPWDALTLSSIDGALYLDTNKHTSWPDSKKQVVVYTSSIYRAAGEGK